jgi:3-dehydroquinate dehydratase-2
MTRVLVINGPNLNLLGTREPEIYGSTTLAEIDDRLVRRGSELGLEVVTFQSNHEGVLIDRIQEKDFDWVIVNAGGLTHTSVALRDALVGVARPFVEVHLSDPSKRETFRHVNYLHDVAVERFVGHGAGSYTMALEFIAHRLGLTGARAGRSPK